MHQEPDVFIGLLFSQTGFIKLGFLRKVKKSICILMVQVMTMNIKKHITESH